MDDDYAGEVPKAYVVLSATAKQRPKADVIAEICQHVADHKAKHKWLAGGVEFADVIPKGPSGKILRRLLRDHEREVRKTAEEKRKNGARL